MLCECEMYDEFRDLDAMSVKVNMNGDMDVSNVFGMDERYERLC